MNCDPVICKLAIKWYLHVMRMCMLQQASSPITSRAHQSLTYSTDLLVSQFNEVRCEGCKDLRQAIQFNVWLKNGLQALQSDFINQERSNEFSYHHGSNHIISALNSIDPMQKMTTDSFKPFFCSYSK